jgi:hypothetical protein
LIGCCDILLQDCPQGEKCVPYSSLGDGSLNAPKCVLIDGDGAPGEACISGGPIDATDDCDASSFCFGYDADTLQGGWCHPLCMGTPDNLACIDGWECHVPVPHLEYCIESCNPLADTCGSDRLCTWTGTVFTCVSTGAEAVVGEACQMPNDCMSGSLCVNGGLLEDCATACCAEYCDLLAGNGPCQAIQPNYVCEPFFMEAPPEYENVGVCSLPQ